MQFLRKGDASESPEIALSSEYEVERSDWFGERWIEVLDHSSDAIDMGRATQGLPLLLDHTTREIAGRFMGVRLDKDKVLRAEEIKWSRSVRGQEAKGDYDDGILPDVSIGYRIKQFTKTGERDGVPIYKATRWEPLEASLVAIPADPTVGKGRSADDGTQPVDIIEPVTEPPGAVDEGRTRMADEATPAVGGTVGASAREKQLANMAKGFGMSDLLPDWIERNVSVDEALVDVQKRIAEQNAKKPDIKPVTDLGLSTKERKNYSLVRALKAASDGDYSKAGFEKEVSDQIAKEFGRDTAPNRVNVPTRWGSGVQTRATGQLDTATSTQGQELVFEEPGSFIELLRNKAVVLRAGARYLNGLVGNVTFPRQSGAGTLVWTGEAPTADVTASNLTLDEVSITPKTAMSQTYISKQLLRQSGSANVDIENLVRSDIAAIHALGIDTAAINGSGASNQPRGLFSITSISVIAMGTNGAAPDYEDLVDIFTQLAIGNAIIDSAALVTTPGVAGKLMKTQKFATTNGEPAWSGTFDSGRILGDNGGYLAFASNQIPSNFTKGTSTTICHGIIAGNWSELFIGEWGALEILVDPYTLAGRNMIRLVSTQMIDLNIRHAASFKLVKDALTA